MTTTGLTADQHHLTAATHDTAAAESFDRCDTDGFLSQWSHQVNADLARTNADLAEHGGRAVFPALFDLDGNLVPAKLVNGQYGQVWGLLANDNPAESFTGWFNPSQARKDAVRRTNNAKKGYYEGLVLAPAAAKLGGGGTGLAGALTVRPVVFRTDGGFSHDVEIVDDGQ